MCRLLFAWTFLRQPLPSGKQVSTYRLRFEGGSSHIQHSCRMQRSKTAHKPIANNNCAWVPKPAEKHKESHSSMVVRNARRNYLAAHVLFCQHVFWFTIWTAWTVNLLLWWIPSSSTDLVKRNKITRICFDIFHITEHVRTSNPQIHPDKPTIHEQNLPILRSWEHQKRVLSCSTSA